MILFGILKLILEVPGRLTNLFRHYKREASKVASFKGLEVSLRSASTKVLTNIRSLILEKPKLSKFSKVSNEKLGRIQNFILFILWFWVGSELLRQAKLHHAVQFCRSQLFTTENLNSLNSISNIERPNFRRHHKYFHERHLANFSIYKLWIFKNDSESKSNWKAQIMERFSFLHLEHSKWDVLFRKSFLESSGGVSPSCTMVRPSRKLIKIFKFHIGFESADMKTSSYLFSDRIRHNYGIVMSSYGRFMPRG